jgi:cellulose synthase/poly-beta-1,6-N-acetylglucosamine synthase-like glycosyltransferase
MRGKLRGIYIPPPAGWPRAGESAINVLAMRAWSPIFLDLFAGVRGCIIFFTVPPDRKNPTRGGCLPFAFLDRSHDPEVSTTGKDAGRMIIQSIVFFLSLILTLLFFLYGFNHYFLLNASRRYIPPSPADSSGALPPVSIHLPIYNEKYVVRRLITACARMAEAYGRDRVNILILDDSDDDTVREIDALVDEFRGKQFRIQLIRRGSRQGYKAGALQAALAATPEDFIAVFDADFAPPPDFLLRTLPHFANNDRLGIVQTRWGYLNRDFNVLTKGTAILMDIHFLNEQPGRYAAGLFLNFNGSGGVLRKQAILNAGGWQADTLAEDLDLSYRMQLQGYRILYLKDLQSPGEIPPTIPNYKQQQSRWACGSLRAAKKILPLILHNRDIRFRQRLEATLHLTGYLIHPLMAITFLLACFSTYFNLSGHDMTQSYLLLVQNGFTGAGLFPRIYFLQDMIWFLLVPLILLCTIAPWISALATLRFQKLPLSRNLTSLMVLFVVGFGASINNTLGAGRGLFSTRAQEWTRTPKYADLKSKTGWRTTRYQIPFDRVWLLELAFAGLGAVAIAFAIQQTNYPVLLILAPFTVAYALVSLLTILQS